jgi:hypothetical protein
MYALSNSRFRMSRAVPLLSLCSCVAHYGENFTFAVPVALYVTTAEQVLIKSYIEDF